MFDNQLWSLYSVYSRFEIFSYIGLYNMSTRRNIVCVGGVTSLFINCHPKELPPFIFFFFDFSLLFLFVPNYLLVPFYQIYFQFNQQYILILIIRYLSTFIHILCIQVITTKFFLNFSCWFTPSNVDWQPQNKTIFELNGSINCI